MPWHDDRTFYACPCGARDETIERNPPRVIWCWACGAKTSRQWLPHAVARDRVPQLFYDDFERELMR